MSGNLPIFERNKERSPPQLDDSTDCIIEQIYKIVKERERDHNPFDDTR